LIVSTFLFTTPSKSISKKRCSLGYEGDDKREGENNRERKGKENVEEEEEEEENLEGALVEENPIGSVKAGAQREDLLLLPSFSEVQFEELPVYTSHKLKEKKRKEKKRKDKLQRAFL